MGRPDADVTVEEEARALRRGSRRTQRLWLAAIVGNVLVAAGLLGGPYLRGRHRALEARAHFAEFAACLTGGEALASPGLGFPEGSAEGTADRFRQDPAWPGDCRDALRAVAPDESFWLLPDTRHAEGETRRAVRMVAGELDRVAGASRQGKVPERPWLATQRLVAALTLWAREADVSLDLEAPAIAMNVPLTLVPTRVPLEAARDAEVALRVRGDGIEAVALDARGISWVRVGGGVADVHRMRRPALVRGIVLRGLVPRLLWATDETRCGDDRCVRRATGVSTLDPERRELPDPVWLAAHPAGELEDAVRFDGEQAWILARTLEGTVLRRFDLLEPAPASEDSETEPAVGEDISDLALDGASFAGASVVGLSNGAVVRDGEVLSGEANLLWVAGGDSLFAGGEARTVWLAENVVEVPVPPLVERHVRTSSEGVAALVGRDAEGVVWAARCLELCEAHAIGPADAFAAGFAGETLVVASSEDGGQIHLALVADGLSRVAAPAACWSEAGGLCGKPFVAAARDRLVLGARDRTDMLMVETRDGRDWRRLRGLY